jgi:hypothetical protein
LSFPEPILFSAANNSIVELEIHGKLLPEKTNTLIGALGLDVSLFLIKPTKIISKY